MAAIRNTIITASINYEDYDLWMTIMIIINTNLCIGKLPNIKLLSVLCPKMLRFEVIEELEEILSIICSAF